MRNSFWMATSLVCGILSYAECSDNRWGNYHLVATGDFVYMRRAQIHNKTLVENEDKKTKPCKCPDDTVIDSKDLVNDFDYEPGWRVALMAILNPRTGFEGNFLYLQPWTGEKKAKGDASLNFPFSDSTYDPDFYDADEAVAKYRSEFWDAELNYWDILSPRRINYFSISGILGLRYFQLDESFRLEMTNPPDKSNYNIHTQNRIYAAQAGLDLQLNPTRWLSWDFIAKVGPIWDWSKQKTFLGSMNNEITLRHFTRHKKEWGIFTDVLADFEIHLFRFLNLHAGYQMIFLSGLTLAPEQISKRTTKHAGDRDYAHGTAIIHGLFAGGSLSF